MVPLIIIATVTLVVIHTVFSIEWLVVRPVILIIQKNLEDNFSYRFQ